MQKCSRFSLLAALMVLACAVQVGAQEAGEIEATPQAEEYVSKVDPEKWELVWSDEFDYTGLPDPEKWDYEVGYVRNNESQYYTQARKENARVEGGMLVIEAHKEQFPNPRYNPESRRQMDRREFADYTAASIHTWHKAEWTYGRIEVRAKVPTGKGTWPAIWMLGTNRGEVGWPTCGEIDIMEYVGYDPERIHANIHTAKYNHTIGTGRGNNIRVEKPWEKFYVYAVEWYPDHMDFFVNDRKYFTATNDGTGDEAWPFDKPQYLILNLAIGGAWGAREGIDDSIFPAQYYIDYVRVYQERKAEAEAIAE